MSSDFSPRTLFPDRLDPDGNEMCVAIANVVRDINLALGHDDDPQQEAHDRYNYLCLAPRISLSEAEKLVATMCKKGGVSTEHAKKYYAFLLSPINEAKLV